MYIQVPFTHSYHIPTVHVQGFNYSHLFVGLRHYFLSRKVLRKLWNIITCMDTHIDLSYRWAYVKVMRSMSRSWGNNVIHQELNLSSVHFVASHLPWKKCCLNILDLSLAYFEPFWIIPFEILRGGGMEKYVGGGRQCFPFRPLRISNGIAL